MHGADFEALVEAIGTELGLPAAPGGLVQGSDATQRSGAGAPA
jgi:hypothetical protein